MKKLPELLEINSEEAEKYDLYMIDQLGVRKYLGSEYLTVIAIKIYEFSERFPDEKTGKKHFKKYRLQEGITRRKCCDQEHYYYKSIKISISRMSLQDQPEKWYCDALFKLTIQDMVFGGGY